MSEKEKEYERLRELLKESPRQIKARIYGEPKPITIQATVVLQGQR